MGTIREKLIVESNAAAVFSSYLNLGRQMAANMRTVTETQNDFTDAANESGRALEEMAGVGNRAAGSVEDIGNAAQKMAGASKDAASSQDRLNRSMRSGASAADGLTRRIMSLAAAYVGLRSAKELIGLSDTWTQTTARLDRMNDGAQPTPQVQDMIYNAAQRSRGSYQDTADMAAKLGTLAPEAFDSTAEVVAFTEQINKQFALAGTSAQGAQAAMLQLTQAMASGVLRGEELNSVLEQAPTITQAIAKYMGVSIGELRDLASEGKVTAQVVKAAMFSAAKDTNAAFESVPLTFSQAWTMVKNEGLNALRPVLEELNAFLKSDIGRDALNGFISAVRMGGELLLWLVRKAEYAASYISENWDTVSSLLITGAVTIAAVMAASAIKTAVSWAMANWQLLLIVGTIALVIYMAREMGYTWEEIGGVVGGVLNSLYSAMYNNVSNTWNLLATFGEFIPNFFQHPIRATANLFQGLFDYILSVVQSAASAIDALLGSNISGAVAGFRSNVRGFVTDVFGENEIKIRRMDMMDYGNAWRSGVEKGRAVGNFLDNFNMEDFLGNASGAAFDYSNMLGDIDASLSNIGSDTKAIKNSVSLSEEDIKLLVDMATRDYVNNINLTSQTPVININGQNTGDFDTDLQRMEESIKRILVEQTASSTDLAYT